MNWVDSMTYKRIYEDGIDYRNTYRKKLETEHLRLVGWYNTDTQEFQWTLSSVSKDYAPTIGIGKVWIATNEKNQTINTLEAISPFTYDLYDLREEMMLRLKGTGLSGRAVYLLAKDLFERMISIKKYIQSAVGYGICPEYESTFYPAKVEWCRWFLYMIDKGYIESMSSVSYLDAYHFYDFELYKELLKPLITEKASVFTKVLSDEVLSDLRNPLVLDKYTPARKKESNG